MVNHLYYDKKKVEHDLDLYRKSKSALEKGYTYKLFKLSEVKEKVK